MVAVPMRNPYVAVNNVAPHVLRIRLHPFHDHAPNVLRDHGPNALPGQLPRNSYNMLPA